MNTSRLAETDAHKLMEETGACLDLPVADPIRGGRDFDALALSCLEGS